MVPADTFHYTVLPLVLVLNQEFLTLAPLRFPFCRSIHFPRVVHVFEIWFLHSCGRWKTDARAKGLPFKSTLKYIENYVMLWMKTDSKFLSQRQVWTWQPNVMPRIDKAYNWLKNKFTYSRDTASFLPWYVKNFFAWKRGKWSLVKGREPIHLGVAEK